MKNVPYHRNYWEGGTGELPKEWPHEDEKKKRKITQEKGEFKKKNPTGGGSGTTNIKKKKTDCEFCYVMKRGTRKKKHDRRLGRGGL